jgi:CxxC-x17-CxxC domain-containing protein
MFKAVCSNCGKDCEVPFEPTNGKPVYCSDCFEKMGGGGESRRFQDRGPRRPDFARRDSSGPQNDEQLEVISRKLDKILAMLTPVPAKEEEAVEVKPGEVTIVAQKKVKTPKKKTPVTKE